MSPILNPAHQVAIGLAQVLRLIFLMLLTLKEFLAQRLISGGGVRGGNFYPNL